MTMMKQVELKQGDRVLRGWVPATGTNGIAVAVGHSVDVPGEGRFNIEAVYNFSVEQRDVKAMQDKARASFTAQKSYRTH